MHQEIIMAKTSKRKICNFVVNRDIRSNKKKVGWSPTPVNILVGI